MATRTIASIDDGFEAPVKRRDDGSIAGDPKPESGNLPATGTPERVDDPTKSERLNGHTTIDPLDFDIIGTGGGNEPGNRGTGKRRGRPPGSSSTKKQEVQNPLIADLESLLLSVHFMGARILSIPEMELDPQEAKKLSDSIKNLAKHYQLGMDPKKLAMLELAFCAGGIYGPRFIAVAKNTQRKPQLVQPIRKVEPVTATATSVPAQRPPVNLSNISPSQLWAESPVEDA